MLPGQEVTLRHDKKGYADLLAPASASNCIPADLTRRVEIRMLPDGSKLFWTHGADRGVHRPHRQRVGQEAPGPAGRDADVSAYILELGRHYGFTADEVRQQIGKWMEVARKDVTDFREQGMVAFAEKNFRLAGENFRRRPRKGAAGRQESPHEAADRELAGDAFYNAPDYRQALQEYRHALHVVEHVSKTASDPWGSRPIRNTPSMSSESSSSRRTRRSVSGSGCPVRTAAATSRRPSGSIRG